MTASSGNWRRKESFRLTRRVQLFEDVQTVQDGSSSVGNRFRTRLSTAAWNFREIDHYSCDLRWRNFRCARFDSAARIVIKTEFWKLTARILAGGCCQDPRIRSAQAGRRRSPGESGARYRDSRCGRAAGQARRSGAGVSRCDRSGGGGGRRVDPSSLRHGGARDGFVRGNGARRHGRAAQRDPRYVGARRGSVALQLAHSSCADS